MSTLYDRVLETTTVTGTGAATLLGAVPGQQSFAVVGNGNSCYICIFECGNTGAPNGAWEVSQSTYTAAGPSLSRSTIISSSNNGLAVNFAAGTKRVMLVLPASKAVFVDTTGNVNINNTLRIAFNSVTYTDLNTADDGTFNVSPIGGGMLLDGSLWFTGDGDYDIGTPFGNRPAAIYLIGSIFGGSASSSMTLGSSGIVKFGSGGTKLSTSTDGNLILSNAAGTSFGLLQLGGSTSSYPALKRNGASLESRLADDTAYANFRVQRLDVGASGHRIQDNGSQSLNISDSAGSLMAQFNSNVTNLTMLSPKFLTFGGASPGGNTCTLVAESSGVISLYDNGFTGFGRLNFGLATAAFPALKRNGTVLESKLADDSDYAYHSAKRFRLGTNGHEWIDNGSNGFYFLIGGSSQVMSVGVTSIATETPHILQVGYSSNGGIHALCTLCAEDSQAGISSNQSGSDFLIRPGISTGNATPAQLRFQSSVPTVSGNSGQTMSDILVITNSRIGFYGVTPTARQLLATGAGRTVDDVISALQTLGLFRQS